MTRTPYHYVRTATGQTLTSRVARLERDIAEYAANWDGTTGEFATWAEQFVNGALCNIGRDCCCVLADCEAGWVGHRSKVGAA